MAAQQVFWQAKTLKEMTVDEWESLCDGCGKCCLHKLEDEETNEVYYTSVACKLLDSQTCRCQDYEKRKSLVPDCLTLEVDDAAAFNWLPVTCAYRLLAEKKPLYDWHPLVSGDQNTVHQSGMSVANRVTLEKDVNEEDMEEYVIRWVV